jgi:hypothetical protein
VGGKTIGLDINGNPQGNGGAGVRVLGSSSGTVIGNGALGGRNIIAANLGRGISLEGSTGTSITGNYIGTDSTGVFAFGNHGDGIFAQGSDNTIGGAGNQQNVISGNWGNGITLKDGNNDLVVNNIIGLQKTGTDLLRNPQDPMGAGVQGNLDNGIEIINSSGNTIGGVNLGNVISANGTLGGVATGNGIYIHGGSSNNALQGNYIGTDNTGFNVFGNTADGVYVDLTAGTGNTIGGTSYPEGNVISGNDKYGIWLDVMVTEDYNFIGVNWQNLTPLPNTIDGAHWGQFGSGSYGANTFHQ